MGYRYVPHKHKKKKKEPIESNEELIESYIKAGNHKMIEDCRKGVNLSRGSLTIDFIAQCYKGYEEKHQVKVSSTPPFYQAINFLKGQDEIGRNIIEAMIRLKSKQDSWMPWNWVNAEKKLNLIETAILKISRNGENLRDHITNDNSELYQALNMKRLFDTPKTKTLEISEATTSFKNQFQAIKAENSQKHEASTPETVDDRTPRM